MGAYVTFSRAQCGWSFRSPSARQMAVSASASSAPLAFRRSRASRSESKSGSYSTGARPDWRHVAFRLASLDDCGDMRAPCGKCGAFLIGPVMALIDADNSGPAACDVVEDALGHFEADAELLQAGGRRSPEIVERPIGDAAPLVEAVF